jgi:hypothetical protein
LTSRRAVRQVHSRQRIRRGSSPRDGDAAERQRLTRRSRKRTRFRDGATSAGPMAVRRRSIGSARASWPVEAMTRRSSSRGMRVVRRGDAQLRARQIANAISGRRTRAQPPTIVRSSPLPASNLSIPADGSDARPPGASGPTRASCSPKGGTRRRPPDRPAAYAKVPSAVPARRPRSSPREPELLRLERRHCNSPPRAAAKRKAVAPSRGRARPHLGETERPDLAAVVSPVLA